MYNQLIHLDYLATKKVYDIFNSNSIVKQIPFFFGLIPYEVYVLPGMYIAILQVIWLSAFNPIQFHLFPHFFAYSFFQLLKGTVGRERPGCKHKDLKGFIDASHCKHKVRFMSFPSGHTGIAFALAAALYAEMTFSDDPKFFDVRIKNPINRDIIKYCGIFVALIISIHRVSKGYHYVGDVLSGSLLGITLGLVSWGVINSVNDKLHELCKDDVNKNKPPCIEVKGIKIQLLSSDPKIQKLEILAKIIITIPVLYLFFKFIIKDFWNLTSIKH